MDINNLQHHNQPAPAAASTSTSQPLGQERAEGAPPSIAAQNRAELNASILEAHSQATLSAGSEPLHLLFSAAIDKLNEILAPEFGDNAIQRAAETPEEYTPEKTAQRIVSMTTGFYASYSEQHPEMDEEERINSFLEVIGSGIDQGFAEARDILSGMQVLEGGIKDGVDKTYELVQQGLSAFRDAILGRSPEPATAPLDEMGV